MGSLPDDFFPYQPPPRERTPTGEVRRVGIEVEFGSLGLDQALTIVASVLGGEIARASPSQGEVKGTPFGSFAVELDSKPLKDRAYLRPLASMGIEKGSSLADQIEASLLRVARELVPIEIVTPPIPWNRLHELNPLWPALRYAGAEDTRDSIFYAFGLHLNPETPDLEVETVLAIFRSYLLLESWIAEASEIDLTRRVTPYIRGFPEEYRRFVLRPEYAPDWPTFITDYVASNPTRNRPLDLLPLFRAASELDLSEQ
ncbi:MAG: amidoligase family protein, partial [Polyangiaceae bacterium]|nr:amidoligase family protein [Polyangiaceae bacterium]